MSGVDLSTRAKLSGSCKTPLSMLIWRILRDMMQGFLRHRERLHCLQGECVSLMTLLSTQPELVLTITGADATNAAVTLQT